MIAAQPEGASRPVRIAVYGSCVGRDTAELLDPGRYALGLYVARQSVISAFSEPVEGLDVSHVESAFQRRMLTGDAGGNLMDRLIDARPEAILWDLTDERLGVLRSPRGEYLTRSVELMRSGLDEQLRATWELVEFGTDRHYKLWTGAVEVFVRELETAGLLDRVVLLRVPWATRSTTGKRPPSNFGVAPAEANRRYRRYYRHLAALRTWPTVRLSVFGARADPGHQWGHAPFHYDVGTYHRMCVQIDARVAAICTHIRW